MFVTGMRFMAGMRVPMIVVMVLFRVRVRVMIVVVVMIMVTVMLMVALIMLFVPGLFLFHRLISWFLTQVTGYQKINLPYATENPVICWYG